MSLLRLLDMGVPCLVPYITLHPCLRYVDISTVWWQFAGTSRL